MPRRKMKKPLAPKASPSFSAGCWRVSSRTKRNLDLAVAASQWGARTVIGLRSLRPGDRVVFYVSKGIHSGYWGTAKVAGVPFLSHVDVWPDDLYPARIRFKLDGPLRSDPVPGKEVLARLGIRRLAHFRQAGVIRLTPAEYRAIIELLAAGGTVRSIRVRYNE